MSKRTPLWRQWRTMRLDSLVVRLANATKTTQYILNDLAALPWGVKPRLYALKGEDDLDLAAELVGTMPSIDPACFVNAYDEGWRVPEGTKGLIYIFETVRHFEFEEILETPEAEAILRSQFEHVHPDKVKSKYEYRRYYVEDIVPKLPPAGLLPQHMRKNMRVAILVMRDGFGTLSYRTEGKEDLHAHSFDETRIGAMGGSGALYQLLHGLRPVDDAVSNVKDFRVLQEIEALG